MKRILIADDSESVAQALAACLTSGYAVTVTYRGDEALRHASTFPTCDLLVTDYLMPEMDGAELALRFRSVHPAAKVLMLTGLGDDLHLDRDPADARLTKPFGPVELRAAVAALIGPPDPAQDLASIRGPGPADAPLGGRLSDPMATSPTFPAPSRTALAQAELFTGAPAPLLASTIAGSETRNRLAIARVR